MDAEFAECMDCHCLAARKTAQRLTRAYAEHLRPHSLTAHQFSLLTVLILAGPSTMTALADRLGVDRTTLSRNVDLSERRGLVKVRRGRDARERVVEIMAAGRAAARKALPAWRAAQAGAFAT
jgi:DNA-binding MarR family transcriptional regulator